MQLSALFTYNGMTLEIVIWSLFIGIVIGSFGAFYNKRILGAFVRELLNNNAHTLGSAKSLDEVGFGRNFLIKNALREKSTYRKVVHAVSSNDSAKFDVDKAKYYIPDECADRAVMVYDAKGTSIIGILLTVLVFFAVALISFAIIPQLVDMIGKLFR